MCFCLFQWNPLNETNRNTFCRTPVTAQSCSRTNPHRNFFFPPFFSQKSHKTSHPTPPHRSKQDILYWFLSFPAYLGGVGWGGMFINKKKKTTKVRDRRRPTRLVLAPSTSGAGAPPPRSWFLSLFLLLFSFLASFSFSCFFVLFLLLFPFLASFSFSCFFFLFLLLFPFLVSFFLWLLFLSLQSRSPSQSQSLCAGEEELLCFFVSLGH